MFEKTKKYLIIPLLIFFILAPSLSPFAQAFSFPQRYDLVAILVEQGLYADTDDYDGLSNVVVGPIKSTTIKQRVDRYAIDVQNALPGSRVLVIQVDRFEKPSNVAAVLERLYFDGDPKEPDRVAYLRGVVVVGEVPLPVVNKQGTRFVSLFPYTDFEQKSYVWNPKTQDFEFRADNANPQPEIWHGVIRPPVSTQNVDGRKLIAAYLDKNHLYHIGDARYTTFDKKVFFQDFIHEKKNLNALAYKHYLNFLEHQDDIAYFRYTKELFKDLAGPAEAELADDVAEGVALTNELAALGIPSDSFVPKPELPADFPQDAKDNAAGKKSKVDKNQIPDIMTKIAKMSDNLMVRFSGVFTKYPNLVNDIIKYTGRYVTNVPYKIDVDTPVNLITTKDQYSISYLKAVNTMVESKIDEVVNRLQKDIVFTSGGIEVTEYKRDLAGKIETLPAVAVNLISEKYSPQFSNFSPAYDLFPATVNGVDVNRITSVAQCSVYRGSLGIGSKLVELNRAMNLQTATNQVNQKTTGRTPQEVESNYKCRASSSGTSTQECVGYKNFAGCFYDGLYPYEESLKNQRMCFPEHATDQVLDPAGTREINNTPPANFDNFNSCLSFNENAFYIDYLKSIDKRLNAISAKSGDDADKKIAELAKFPLSATERHPRDIKLFSVIAVDKFDITLEDILRGVGWDNATNPNGWKDEIGKFVLNTIPNETKEIALKNHSKVISATIKFTRPYVKAVSSVFYHKEPSLETIAAQTKNLIAKDLPVDNPRYVTFQNQTGTVSRITYPNVFAAANVVEFANKLQELENQLNALPRSSVNAPAPCVNCLTGLVTIAQELSSNPPKSDTVISRANTSKLADAILWKNMDIDTKHEYLITSYFDEVKDPYIGKPANGYELAYFNGEGNFDEYQFSVNVDVPEESDAAFLKTEKEAKEKEETPKPYEDDPSNPFDDFNPSEEKAYDILSFIPFGLPWFKEIKKWAGDLVETVNKLNFSKKKEDSDPKKELEAIKEENSEIEGSLTMQEEPTYSRISRIELNADSTTIVSNKKTNLSISLLDKNSAIVNDQFEKITLNISGQGEFGTDLLDGDPTLPGYQITLMSGKETYGLIADLLPTDEKTGSIKITAQIDGTEVKDEMKLTVIAEGKLVLKPSVTGILANGKETTKVSVEAQDGDGKLLTTVNGIVKVSVSDPLMGKVVEREIKLVSGISSFNILSGKKAGQLFLNSTMSSLDSGGFVLNMLPGAPHSIALSATEETLPTVAGEFVDIVATLYDEYGNAVTTNSATQIDFRISSATEEFASLSSASEKVKDGLATVKISPKAKTGTVNVIAESRGLSSGIITIKSIKKISSSLISQMKPNALAVAILGIPAGDVTSESYLGGWMLANGRTQAAVSLTAPAKQNLKLFDINEHGSVSIGDEERIQAQFIADNNFSLLLRDVTLNQDIAKLSLFALAESEFDVLDEFQEPDTLADGIYLVKNTGDEKYKVDKIKGSLRLVKEDSERMEVHTNGFVRIFDNEITLSPVSGKYLTLDVLDAGESVAQILFVQRFNQDVRVGVPPNAPGVYVQPLSKLPKIKTLSIFSGNSTAAGKGVAFYDKSEEVKGADAPGFSFNSLEDSQNQFGIGFTQDNKFGLLFAAGETFGEANKSYASDIGIVLGDPTIRIDNRESGSFSSDTGKLVYAGSADTQALIDLDYNNDGLDDILVAQQDGKIRLIQNNGGYDQLKDQGYLFDIKNGIQDITKTDFNNDGRMDLVIAAKTSCKVGDTCIDIYENTGAAFSRINLAIPQTEKITTIRAEDLNNDKYPDIIFADTAGDIKILYNRKGVFDKTPQVIGNVGLKVDPTKNLITSVLVNYSGMPAKDPADPFNPITSQLFQSFSIKEQRNSPNLEMSNLFPKDPKDKAKIDNEIVIENLDFIYADLDPSLKNSTKLASDLNGGVIKTGDRIRYTITLKNDSASAKRAVKVSDSISNQLELDFASIQCVECAASEMQVGEIDADETRPIVFKNITIPAQSIRTIQYEAVFRGEVDTADKVTFIFSNTFEDTNANLKALLRADKFTDIAVTKDGNPTGRVRYFYTTGINNGTLQWSSELSSAPPPADSTKLEEETGIKFPVAKDFETETKCIIDGKERPEFANKPEECRNAKGRADPTAPPKIADDGLKNLTGKDSDGDGLSDVVDDIEGALDNIAEVTSALISKLTCSGGCIPMPVNMAFLSPGFFSLMGIPVGFDLGLPVFAWGVPSTIPVWPPSPWMASQGGRLYVSPSLTGGIGFGLCLGTYGTSQNCFSFGINPLDMMSPGLCDKINGAVSGVMSTVANAVNKANEGLVLTAGGAGGGNTGADSRYASGSGLGNYSLGSYDSPTSKSINIRTPGFPSIITDWWARQMEEFTDKLLNLPDIYLIYPEISSIIGAFKPRQQFSKKGNLLTNILNYLNSLPILDIETEEVIFKIPILTNSEIEKLKSDARQWIEDERAEIEKFIEKYNCIDDLAKGKSSVGDLASLNSAKGPDICKIILVDMNGLINSVGENMRALDEWVLFPKQVLKYRAIESYYLTQIIEYLDTIILFTGGWIKKNVARIELWKKAIRDIKNILSTWQGILDLMIDLNESCDKCKTERMSLKDLILKIFIAIPSPPVIPMPKLPDFVIDVSRVQAGIRLKWPDIKFQPAAITIPKLPRISLDGDLSALFQLSLPKIPVIPKPPQLPDLPALPALNLPKLPDIPPPPKIPGLPKPITVLVTILRKIVKILCIITLGFTPTDEMQLKTKIEEITARGLTPLIPLDTLITVQFPTIPVTYVDQLRVTGYTNLKLDLDFIQKFVESIAEQANGFTTNLAGTINSFTNNLSKEIEKQTTLPLPTLPTGPQGREFNYVPYTEEELTRELSNAFGQDMTDLVKLGMQVHKSMGELEKEKIEHEKIIASIPEKITLAVETETFNPNSVSQDLIADSSELSLPVQVKLKKYRDGLAAYVDDTNRMISTNSLNDTQDIARWLANQKHPFADNLKRFFADTTFEEATAGTTNSKDPVNVGKLDLENIDWIAALPQGAPEIQTPGMLSGSSDPTSLPNILNTGIFFVAPNGTSKRLVNYTLESERASSLSNIDIDNDGDSDKLYSYGQNVFLKKSDRVREKEKRPVFRPVDLEYWTIFELLPKGTSQNFPMILSESTRQSSVNFEGGQMGTLAGYEVVAKNSPYFFENPSAAGNHKTIRSHMVPDISTQIEALDEVIRVEQPEGEIFINSQPLAGGTLVVGDYIETGKNSSVRLRASDGTILLMQENTSFVVTQGGIFELIKGKTEIRIPKEGSLLLPAGTEIRSNEATVRIRFYDGSDIEMKEGESFVLLDLKPVIATIEKVSGTTLFTGQKREYVSEDDVTEILNGEIIHPIKISTITWDVDGASERKIKVSKNVMLPVPANMKIRIEDGLVEIIRAEKSSQTAAVGMALQFDDQLITSKGSAGIKYGSGNTNTISSNEIFTLNKLDALDSPTLTIDLDPAFYTTKIYAFDDQGNRSSASEKILLAPQICGDKSPPTANFGATSYTVGINKTLSLDAQRSFDSDGKIVSYVVDTDTTLDSNNDDIPNNDPDIVNGEGQTEFTVGPFDKLETRKMRLIVKDEAGNEGYQDITVKVITPRIVLEVPPLRSNIVKGYIEPLDENVPITIARFRPGPLSLGWEILKTISANEYSQYFTDAAGKFAIKDADFRERLVVKNSKGEITAEINTKTGRITITDDRYEKRMMPREEPYLAPRIGVFLKSDSQSARPLAYVYYVPDINVDGTIDGNDINYDIKNFESMSGVHVKPLKEAYDLGMNFKVLPAIDTVAPGAISLTNTQTQLAIIDVNGDLLTNDKRIDIREKYFAGTPEELRDQPVIFELLLGKDILAEIFIAAHGMQNDRVEIIDTASAKPIARPKVDEAPFSDIDPADPFFKIVADLFKKGVIAGYPSGKKGELFFKPDNEINRAEFTQITLKMLCIVPREEAKTLPTPFYDVLDPKLWFYPVLKEGNIRGFIRGYLGESKTNPQSGALQTPFKPSNNITRAEATTVVIAALQEQDIIDLSKADLSPVPGGMWYDPYIRIAQDLRPYLRNPGDAGARSFLITKEEARDPNLPITRRDFATMADRVLLFYNCHKVEAPIVRPAEPAEPKEPKEKLSKNEGIFVARPTCNICPCYSTVGEGADLLPGDLIFAAISGKNGLPIYAKSNEETY